MVSATPIGRGWRGTILQDTSATPGVHALSLEAVLLVEFDRPTICKLTNELA